MTWIDRAISDIDGALENFDRDEALRLVSGLLDDLAEECVEVNERLAVNGTPGKIVGADPEAQFPMTDDDVRGDLMTIRGKLEHVRDRRSDPLSRQYAPVASATATAEANPVVTVSTDAKAEAKAQADVSVVVSQAFREVDESGLSEDEANAVKALLAEAQNPPDRETRAQKLVKAVEWAADKGPKLVEAVMKAGGAIAGLPLWG